jgi:hypothetical protein
VGNRFPFQGALGEVYLLAAALAEVLFVKLVGEYLLLLAAIRALAGEGLEPLELLKARAMTGGGHDVLLF